MLFNVVVARVWEIQRESFERVSVDGAVDGEEGVCYRVDEGQVVVSCQPCFVTRRFSEEPQECGHGSGADSARVGDHRLKRVVVERVRVDGVTVPP